MRLLALFIVCFFPFTAVGDECSNRQAKTGLISGYGISLRNGPGTTTKAVKFLNLGTTVHIVERGQCATLAGKTGRWVKVRATLLGHGKQPLAEGWMFDAYVAYPDMFKPGNQWNGPAEWIEADGVSFLVKYTFGPGATFTHERHQIEGAGIHNTGYVFSFGNILMLNIFPEQPKDLTGLYKFVVKDRNGNLCRNEDAFKFDTDVDEINIDIGEDGICPKTEGAEGVVRW